MSITPCRDPFGIGVFWAILCGQSMQNSFSRGSKPSFYWHLSVGEPKQRHLSEASTVSGFSPYQYIVGVWLAGCNAFAEAVENHLFSLRRSSWCLESLGQCSLEKVCKIVIL